MLRASSGPVAPPWRWSLAIEARRAGDRIEVHDRRVRGASHPRGALDVERDGAATLEAFESLARALAAAGALEPAFARTLDETTRRRKGAGPGVLRIELDGGVIVAEFLASALDDADAESGDAPLRTAIAAIEAFADAVAARSDRAP
jgi:hypothetical protein